MPFTTTIDGRHRLLARGRAADGPRCFWEPVAICDRLPGAATPVVSRQVYPSLMLWSVAPRQLKTGIVSLKPVSRRFGKEFFQGNALSAYEQLPLGLEQPDEGIHSRKRFAARSALHFNGSSRLALLQNKVHFMVSFTPISDADVRSKSGIDQVRADAGFDEPPPI